MEIQNLNPSPISNTPINNPTPITINPLMTQKQKIFNFPLFLIVVVLALSTGFWASRFNFSKSSKSGSNSIFKQDAISSDEITSIEVGKIYGEEGKNFSDIATGVIEKGSINGEGTHILNREGGASQRASLTSSAVDLDLFVGKKVEIKGETNSSNKTSWLLDVGTVKVLE
jgi:hypothetical protein